MTKQDYVYHVTPLDAMLEDIEGDYATITELRDYLANSYGWEDDELAINLQHKGLYLKRGCNLIKFAHIESILSSW